MNPNELTNNSDAVILYFSHDACNVCKVLLPKIKQLVSDKFPKVELKFVDTKNEQEVAAQFQIFTVPSILIFFEGKEYQRFSRNIGLNQLEEAISRPYQLLFDL
ncbi:thioredoxin family protein [Carboxylicivirga sp. N1Y90]|uniref:thioredoxin family protein n=1 Tax=Carboxylicivirga fragile TaxID=3417571 RepID=UPI003D3558DA|nr:thioredoxin family protein [Marinilabiliaceae bacterium N1Y90]